VRGIPVIKLLRSGRVFAELAGAQPAEAVLAWFQRHK
jgi:thioredoxin-like negative regulator of GroEL